MSLNSEITRIENAKEDIKDAIEDMGGTVGEGTIDTYATAVRSIPVGVGTETDPVFTNSPAYGITSNDITNWNGKSTFSGSYNDLTNKPSIPTKLSDLTDDLGSNPTHTHSQYLTSHQSLSSKQDLLVSGTNIKTINNQSILGSGNITISDISDSLGDDVYIAFFSGGSYGIMNFNYTSNQKNVLDKSFQANADGKTVILINISAYSEEIGITSQCFIRPFYICKSPKGTELTSLIFECIYLVVGTTNNSGNDSTLVCNKETATITRNGDNYTVSTNNMKYVRAQFLSTDYSGNNVFIPTNNNHPANKKYVDDCISSKLDTSKIKNTRSTTAGDVYDVRYVNSVLGDISTVLASLVNVGGGN